MTTMLSEADIEQTISESPSDLTDLYESITSQIMQSNNKATQKLLIWTVFGRRALTLHELEDALAIQETSDSIESLRKYRIHDLTESTITSAAGIILEIVDGKVYLIHQSAKDFLVKSEHLTKAAFCRGLQPDIYLAKICMTYLCFTDFIEAVSCRDSGQLAKQILRHPFLHYAARNWHRHIKIGEKFNDFDIIIGRLTKPGSLELLAWGEVAGIANLDTAENAWDIATMANIPWLAEFQSRGSIITEDMIKKAVSHSYTGYNFMKSLTGKPSFHLTESAIYAAVKYFDHETIRQLLDKDASIVITPELIEATASNQKYGRLVIDLLLEFQDKFMVTEELVQLAADNNISSKEIIELILHKDNTNISEGAVAKIAANFDIGIMRVLVNLREDIKFTNKVTEAVMSRRYDCQEMMMFLLDQSHIFQITEEFIQTIAEYFNVKAMDLVLEKQSRDFWITEEVIKAAARNWHNGYELMAWFLHRRADFITITEETVSTIAEHFNEEVITLVLSRRGDDITITENVINAAVKNRTYSEKVITAILDQRGDEVFITAGVITTVARNSERSDELMTLLLDRRGSHMTITEEVITAIAVYFNEKVFEIFLGRRKDNITITEEVIEAVARISWRSDQKMISLLNQQGDSITITENGLSTIAAKFNEEIMEFVLNQRGNEITITQKVLTAAARNRHYSKEVIKLLLDQRGNEITITEEVVTAAAGNTDLMTLLLEQRGDEITITEKVMKAAVEASSQAIEFLFDRRGDEIIITEEIMKAAAGRSQFGVEFLLDRRGYEITITEEVIIAAVRGSEGHRVMKLLLDRRGNKVAITEKISYSSSKQ